MNGSFPLWLFGSSSLFFYLGSRPWAKLTSPNGAVSLLSKERIQSVSFVQLLGEIVVVGSHLALSWHSRQGQSAIDSMDAGSLLGKRR